MAESKGARADPKKEFFIDVLTMDIDYKSCILDLIDNSVDAFTKTRRVAGNIKINFSEDSLEIYDDCGGIKETDLLETVFRFGGHIERTGEDILGIYGIGLKRAIFKIGNAFEFESYDGKDHNIVYEDDLSKWKERDTGGIETWRFKVRKGTPREKKGYSRLRIYKLKDAYKKIPTLKEQISRDIRIKYVMFMNEGLSFHVNGVLIEPMSYGMPNTAVLEPAVKMIQQGDLRIKIICGYNPRASDKAREKPPEGKYGWNIFCNNRLILLDDTTASTGWGESGNTAFHTLYYPFSGYVWINSKDVSKLPVNTTKTGLVTSHETYKLVLKEMWALANPILSYIYKVRLLEEGSAIDEAEEAAAEQVSEDAEKMDVNSNQKSIFELNEEKEFKAPLASKKKREVSRIQYDKPIREIEIMKKRMRVKSKKKVGEKSFEYYLEQECGGI